MNRWVKKLSAVALTAGMLMSNISYMPMTFSVVNAVESEVEEEVHIWDGTTDVSWYDDEETEFHISTPEQLAGLSSIVNTGKTMEGKTFILDNDIYLNDVSTYDEWETTPPKNEWTSIGISSNYFSGSFDGNGYIISGLFMNTAKASFGLFGAVKSGEIKNLHMTDVCIFIPRETPANAATIYGGIIVGNLIDSNILLCTTDGNINISNSSGKSYGDSYVGGICGNSNSASLILNCINNAFVTSYISSDVYDSGQNPIQGSWNDYAPAHAYGGGICGNSQGIISSCQNNGSVTTYATCDARINRDIFSIESNAGGIVGKSSGKIYCCVNNGSVLATGRDAFLTCKHSNYVANAGGIVGLTNASIENCYNTGDTLGRFAGGIIASHSSGFELICNVYNTGIPNSNSSYGYNAAIIARDEASSKEIKNAYYLSGTSLEGGTNTIAKTEANMKKESFADSLGEAFYYVEGEFPKLAFEVGRTISNFDKTSLAFKEFGETQTLSLDTTYLGEPEWVSSDTSVATVDSDGVVTAVGNGTAMIYALCSDSKAACSVTVGYDYYLSDNELTLKKGRVHDLSVLSASTGEEVTDIDVEWSSSDDSIVSVDSEGKIITNAVGTAAITAKVADLELSCIVSVYEYQVPAVIVPDDENAPKLSEIDFTISTIDSKLLSVENYSDSITWVSANTSIAKVSKNGLVKGVSEGNTMIYALLSDGRCLKANAVVTKSEYTMGDVNLDGEFNVTDAVLLQKWLLAVPDVELKRWENADFYADGKLDVFDLCMMKNALITK